MIAVILQTIYLICSLFWSRPRISRVEDSGQLGAAALDSDKQKPISIMNYKCPISWHPTLGTWPRLPGPEHNWEHFSNSFLFTSFYSVTKHKKLLPVKSFAFQIIELYQAGLGWAGLAGLAGLGMTALERIVWGLIKPIITCWLVRYTGHRVSRHGASGHSSH